MTYVENLYYKNIKKTIKRFIYFKYLDKQLVNLDAYLTPKS